MMIFSGFGSLGAVAEGPLVASLASHFGWDSLPYCMCCLSLLAFLFLLRVKSIFNQ
jgi:sugar phosphate permease